MAGTHSRYSGSMFHRVLRCPGSVRLAASLPPTPEVIDRWRAEGDAAHALLAAWVSHGLTSLAPPCDNVEMRSAVGELVEYINVLRERWPDLVVLSEVKFTFPQRIVPAEDAAGTADVVAWTKAGRRAWLIDFKYGAGEVVPAENNQQLLFYATSAFWRTREADFFTLVIYQPRIFNGGGGADEWVVDASDLVDFRADAEAAIEAAERPSAPLIPGDPQCHWCPAGPVCLAREKLALAVVTEDPNPVREYTSITLPRPIDLGVDRIAYVLEFGDYLRAWIKDVEAYAYSQAMSGVPVPGRKLVYSQSRRRWNSQAKDPQEIAAALAKWSGLPLSTFYRPTLAGITDAEKQMVQAAKGAGLDPAAAKNYMAWFTIKESSGAISLVSERDRRETANPIADAFSGVTIEHDETPLGVAHAAAPPSSPAPTLIPGINIPFGVDDTENGDQAP